MRINDDQESEWPILDVGFEYVPSDVELWIKNERKDTIAIIGLEQLLKDELNGEGNGNGDFVIKSGAAQQWERSAQIFERMAAMIRTALIATFELKNDNA